jgi:predicted membrane protein
MKKLLIVLALIPWVSRAQEFKVAKSSGKLEVHLGRVLIEGYNGNDIVFSSEDGKNSKDDRAEGLRAINGLGLEDNTGLGINVEQTSSAVIVRQLKKVSSPQIKILVPKGIIVSFQHDSQYGGKVLFKNMDNEIEVSAQYNSVELENITGPMTIKSIYGHVEANFSSSIKSPISIVSVYGYVDITIPSATKANLKMDTSYGEIFVTPDLKFEVNREGSMTKYSDRVQGKLNGGGDLNIDLSSNYGKIYLRKK